MEETELKLKEIIIQNYGSLKKFCEKIDMPWTTLDSILKRGVSNSNISNVMKITKELDIDTESLAYGIIEKKVSTKILDSLSTLEVTLLQAYRNCDETEKEMIHRALGIDYSAELKGDVSTAV